jgi:hypothetical protein
MMCMGGATNCGSQHVTRDARTVTTYSHSHRTALVGSFAGQRTYALGDKPLLSFCAELVNIFRPVMP